MNDIALEFNHVWKKFKKGEKYDSLRDLIPAMTKKLFRGNNREELQGKEFWALKDVSFQVKRGEALGIIGPNGAGKSTILKVLSGILKPNKGQMKVNGRLSALIEVGAGFHPDLTGRENIYLNGSILGMKKQEIDMKFDEIVDFSGISEFIDTPVKRYSSGMFARLGFSVAAHVDPDILIVDEVLAVGDAAFQRKCLEKMQTHITEGHAVIFVSHQMEAIANLCKSVLLIEKGEVITSGDSEAVITHYLSKQSPEQYISLRERSDRDGFGRLRFTETWIEDEMGKPLTVVRTGAAFKIVALYEVINSEQISGLIASFALSSIRNIQISNLSNLFTGELFENIVPMKGRLECHIPRLPLNVGTYYYSVYAASQRGLEDWVKNAGKFDVINGSFYSTGIMPDKSRIVLIDHSWQLKDDKSS